MQVSLSLSPGYRLKISRASRMSDLADRNITGLAALGGSAAFLKILRRWIQRRQEKRQEQSSSMSASSKRAMPCARRAYQREREALQALAEECERRHKAELAALEAQMQAKVEALTRANEDLARDLQRAGALLSLPEQGRKHGWRLRKANARISRSAAGKNAGLF